MGCIFNQEEIYDCTNKPKGGLNVNAIYEYNYSEWQGMIAAGLVVFDVDGKITSITNSPGVQLYKKDQPENATQLEATLVQNTGSDTYFSHAISALLRGTGQSQKNVMESATDEKRVAIIVKNSGEAEVWGSEQGMILKNQREEE